MPIAVTPQKQREFVLESERSLPKTEQTTFYIRSLKRMEMTSVRAALDKDMDVMAYQAALEKGLVGWSNFRDEAGNIVEFKKTKDGFADAESLERIDVGPNGWGDELARAIIRFNKLTDDERKNSDSPAS